MAYVYDEHNGTTNDTTEETLVPAPAAGKTRIVKSVNIYNKDTENAIVTVSLKVSSNLRIICKVELEPGDHLDLSDQGPFILNADDKSLVCALADTVDSNQLDFVTEWVEEDQ